eukprot:Ihof_evm9s94 gene=Ihof_evmTU9s94
MALEQQALWALGDYLDSQGCHGPAIQCLEASILVPSPARVEARTRMRLGQLYFHHTMNMQQARIHVDRATTGMDDVRYEAIILLVEILRASGDSRAAKSLLKMVLEHFNGNMTYLYQLSLQAAVICGEHGETAMAATYLKTAQGHATRAGDLYMQALLLLSEAQLHLMAWQQDALGPALAAADKTVGLAAAAVQTGRIGQRQADSLVVYLNVLHVLHLVRLGQTTTLSKHVVELHSKMTRGPLVGGGGDESLDGVPEWMGSKQLFAVVFVITVITDLYGGRLKKGVKHGQQALDLIQ